MKDSDKVLVDTSAWIEFFRKKAPYHKAVLELIDSTRICCTGIVLAGLIQGAKSQQEVDVLKEFLQVFDFLPDSTELWEKAGELSRVLRQKGKTIGLSYCYISVVVHANNVQLLTLDKHFEIIGKEIELNLYSFT
ncbi:MAG: PIN domain nuclease [Candidatus Jettenia sp.]|uniref:Ribonuclease VapC n=1 Tax=Candidatus Jettenia caeni TaxID=247490 RepID=I3INX0_9BACT|nr:PIN domain-containing protein [Candidatus Jettenia sp. AMX1]MBC6927563.1 PIN domain nuclease [Candidatus Jettenia sp.]NUO10443.1 PIN domain-containing protein [Candidatus Brocadia sp.]WKZ15872.1 MAG: PIN domain-containing protein [Candidatus Jettenia caeni]KAA0251540.1 MAG: PIN domain nuclease [Candidatus Jettenia sp. AMX1]MCE7881322.1 PIN domain nuclease [Candidatus Jettenia sp. AMX1]